MVKFAEAETFGCILKAAWKNEKGSVKIVYGDAICRQTTAQGILYIGQVLTVQNVAQDTERIV